MTKKTSPAFAGSTSVGISTRLYVATEILAHIIPPLNLHTSTTPKQDHEAVKRALVLADLLIAESDA